MSDGVHVCCIQDKQAREMIVGMFIKETLPGDGQSRVKALYRSCSMCKAEVDKHSFNRAELSAEDVLFDKLIRKALQA